MKAARWVHATCLMYGKTFVVGGLDDLNKVVNTVKCYEPLTDAWNLVDEIDTHLYDHFILTL